MNWERTLSFRASTIFSKILNVKKYLFSAVNSGQTLLFRASESCSKILNNKNMYWIQGIQSKVCFSGQAQSCSKSWIARNKFNTVTNFRASANCSKILNGEKTFNAVYSVHIHLRVIPSSVWGWSSLHIHLGGGIWASVMCNLDQSPDWL